MIKHIYMYRMNKACNVYTEKKRQAVNCTYSIIELYTCAQMAAFMVQCKEHIHCYRTLNHLEEFRTVLLHGFYILSHPCTPLS